MRVSFCTEFGDGISNGFDGGDAFEVHVFVDVVGRCWERDFWDLELVVPAEESVWFGADSAVVKPIILSDAELVESAKRLLA